MISIRKGMWETNSSTLHQFTICTDQIPYNVQDNPIQDSIIIRINEDILNDKEFKASSIQERFDVIIVYAISDIIDSIVCGKDAGEDWTVHALDYYPKYRNEFNNTLEWLYNLQKRLMAYIKIENPMTKNKWIQYSYFVKDKYTCHDWRLIGTDMFSEFNSDSNNQIMRWPLDDVIKFILNNNSYYYQVNHGDWDPDEMLNDDHFKTIYMEE